MRTNVDILNKDTPLFVCFAILRFCVAGTPISSHAKIPAPLNSLLSARWVYES